MNFNSIHVPERLPGETFPEYRARRNWSRMFAGTQRPVTALPLQHRADAKRTDKRAQVAFLGVRQFKRITKRAARLAKGDAQ